MRHGERRHGAGAHAGMLNGGFQHEGIHDGRQHPHRIGRGPRQPVLGDLRPAKDVAAADHDAELYSHFMGGDEIGGKAINAGLVDAEFFGPAQGLAGKFDDHPSVPRARHRHVPPLAAAIRGPAIRLSHPHAKQQGSARLIAVGPSGA